MSSRLLLALLVAGCGASLPVAVEPLPTEEPGVVPPIVENRGEKSSEPESDASSAAPVVARESGPPPAAPTAVLVAATVAGKLPSGLEVLVAERPGAPLVQLHLVTRAGSAVEPADRAGLAHLVAQLLSAGTSRHERRALAEAVDLAGGRLTVEATRDASAIDLVLLPDHLDEGLALVVELAQSPTFPEAALEADRKAALAELGHERSPSLLAEQALRRLALAGTPYASEPTAASLQAITREDLLNFHSSRYRPEESQLIIVGDVKARDLLARVTRSFAGWKAARRRTPSPSPSPSPSLSPTEATPRIHLVPTLPSTHARLALAWRVPPRSHAQHAALLLLAEAIDVSLDGDRANARLDLLAGGGLFTIERRVPVAHAAVALRGLQALAARLSSASTLPISAADLAAARQRLHGKLARTLDAPGGLARLVALERIDGVGPGFWTDLGRRLDALDLAALHAVAAQLKPAAAHRLVVGDAALEGPLRAVAPVSVAP